MGFNPNRAVGKNMRRTARRYDPKAGHRRARNAGPQGIDLGELQHRENTGRGWRVISFRGDDFEMVYELIAAHNATGTIKNDQADRALRVLHGRLFVLMNGEIITIREGQGVNLPKGSKYELSSDVASDVEVIFCQGSDYENGIEVVEPSDAINPTPLTSVPTTQPDTKRNPTGKAMSAAEKISAEKMRRQAARDITKGKTSEDDLVGQSVPGANLRPMGDPGEGKSE